MAASLSARSSYARRLQPLLLSAIPLLVCVTAGAEDSAPPAPPQPPATQPAEPQTVRVIQLQSSRAQSLAPTIAQTLAGDRSHGRITVMAAAEGNQLIVSAGDSAMAKIMALVQQLDVPTSITAAKREYRLFELKHVAANNDMIRVIQTALGIPSGGPSAFPLACHTGNNVLVYAGTREDCMLAERLITQLDRPGPADAAAKSLSSLRVRIVWLTTGGTGSEAVAAPADLKAVADQLAGFGLTNLALAAQAIVETLPGNSFRMNCTTAHAEPCDMTVNGKIIAEEVGGPISLQISLSTSGLPVNKAEPAESKAPEPPHPPVPGQPAPRPPMPGPGRQRNSHMIETNVVTPPGKPIILAVTPMGPATSVFIVQVLPSN